MSLSLETGRSRSLLCRITSAATRAVYINELYLTEKSHRDRVIFMGVKGRYRPQFCENMLTQD